MPFTSTGCSNSTARLAWRCFRFAIFLIGRGALAANYLAELAQNANDAYDETPEGEQGAQVRIILEGQWLFVQQQCRK